MTVPALLSGFGQYHTNEPGKANRRPYAVITWAQIQGMVDAPQDVKKEAAQWLIPSTLSTRTFKEQEANGEFHALWVDLDKNPRPLEDVREILVDIICGKDFEIYTSKSAREEYQKARILISLSAPLCGTDWLLCQEILNDSLEAKDIEPDRKSQGAAQLCYLPNKGDYYHQLNQRTGETFDPLTAWAGAIEQKGLAIERERAAALAEIEAAKLKRGQRYAGGFSSPIDAFNTCYTVEEILMGKGYQRRGKSYRHPASESGSYSASVKNGRVYSLSSNDPLFTSDAGNGAHDAFSAFAVLYHKGNRGEAIKDAGDKWLTLGGESWNKHHQREHAKAKSQSNEVIAKAHVTSNNQPPIDEAVNDEKLQKNKTRHSQHTQHSLSSNPSQPVTDSNPHDLHRNAPKPSEAMLYGLVGEIGIAAAVNSEANRYAVAANCLAFLSAAFGRDVFDPIGDTNHHARLFTLHVGRSSIGRKGDATSLVKLIRRRIEELNLEAGNLDTFCGGHHYGGLSSREGLAFLIHDGYTQGKEEFPAIRDKRLWIVESEFANILHQAKRDGNTLSAALRDTFDGASIQPATKTARLWATNPHIAISAAITPTELRELMESRELSNGFANRFLIFWAERERIEPFPKPTHPALVDSLAGRVMSVIRFARGNYPDDQDSRKIMLSDEAKAEYERIYRGELSAIVDSEKIMSMLQRRAPMLRRIATIFALTDLSLVVELKHINAALAWTRFNAESVRFIFNDVIGEEDAKESSDAAQKILGYLGQYGKTSRWDLSKKCFAGHLNAKHLDSALDSLLMNTPPAINLTEGELANNGKRAKYYQLPCAKLVKLAELPTGSGIEQLREVARLGFSAKLDSPFINPTTPTSQPREVAATRATKGTSQTSPTSQPVNKKANMEAYL